MQYFATKHNNNNFSLPDDLKGFNEVEHIINQYV